MAVIAHTAPARAAAITWGAVTNETGNLSDFVTTGTLFDAIGVNGTRTVGGITFYGESPSATAANVTFSGSGLIQGVNFNAAVYPSGNDFPLPPGTWDSGYAALVSGNVAIPKNSGSSLVISGLTVGESYEVQLFMPFWDVNWKMTYSDGTNTTPALNVGSPDSWAGPGAAVPQYVTGTFTANASTETIYTGNALPGTVFTAMQVRTLSESSPSSPVPEPSALLLMVTALAAVGGAHYVRRGTKTI